MKTVKTTILLLVIISVQLLAQVGVELKVSGGGALPMGPNDFKDNWKMGYGAGAGLTLNLMGGFAIEGEAEYYNFAFDGDKLVKSLGYSNMGISISGGAVSVISAMANLKLYLLPKVSPVNVYIFGGGGLTSLKFDEVKMSTAGYSQSTPSQTQSKAGAQAGAGVKIGLGSIRIFAEGKYVMAFTPDKNTAFCPVKAGLIFGF